jgi:hypothetical protein
LSRPAWSVDVRLAHNRATPNEAPFTIRRRDGTVLVQVHGPLTELVVERFRHVLFDLIDEQGNLRLAVDLPDVRVIDLETLDLLVEAGRRLEANNGCFAVTSASGQWSMPVAPLAGPVPR